MSESELRAHELFKALNLRNEDEEVRRNLIILMLTVPQMEKKTNSFTETLAGRWQRDEDKERILMESFGAWGDDEDSYSTEKLCADVKEMMSGDDFVNKYL